MPQYRRYGYVTTMRVKTEGEWVESANIAFHLNPKKAHDNLDVIINSRIDAGPHIKYTEDKLLTPEPFLLGSSIRSVFIEYVDGVTLHFNLERWHVVVGRE